MGEMKNVTYGVRLYDPNRDAAPHWETFTIPCPPGMTVLDGLWKIKELHAPGLAWRSSCRMGVCGSCGMLINGRPGLACNTQVADLKSPTVTVAPLPNFAIIRDLVPDLGPMIERHQELRPYIIRDDIAERENPTGEFFQSAHELEQYLQFSYCIKCGSCMAACPTYATDPDYSGRCRWRRRTATTPTRATRASRRARTCSRGVPGHGAATSPASARRCARRGSTRRRRSSS